MRYMYTVKSDRERHTYISSQFCGVLLCFFSFFLLNCCVLLMMIAMPLSPTE